MKNEEILKKAIEKAKKNGYEWYGDLFKHWEVIIAGVGFWDENVDSYAKSDHYGRREHWSIEEIIFSHSFAKAFWGEEIIADCGKKIPTDEIEQQWDRCLSIGGVEENEMTYKELDKKYCFEQSDPECPCWSLPCWKHHLTIIVLEENPIKYLEQFIS